MTEKKASRAVWWFGAGVLILGIAAAIFYGRSRTPTVVYREIPVSRADMDVTILSTGTVAPENRLEIKPPIAGRVEKVLVEEGAKVRKGQVLAWMSSTERAALLDGAQAKGPEELKRWEELYRATPILAPIDGAIILRNVEAGQTFTNSESVYSMSDRLTVQAQVDETDIAQIRLGQDAHLVLDAYPNQTIPAVVDKIAFDAKVVNNVTTYIVDVLPKKAPDSMRSGMTANVTFLVASKKDALTLPSDALRVRDNKYFVFLKGSLSEDPLEKEVGVGLNNGKRTEILSGLSEKDVVLVATTKGSAGRSSQGTNPFSPMGNTRRPTGR